MDWFKSQTIFFPWDSNSNLSSDFHLSFQIKERGVVANKLETLSTMSQHRHTKQIMRLEALCLNGRTFDGKNMYANIKKFVELRDRWDTTPILDFQETFWRREEPISISRKKFVVYVIDVFYGFRWSLDFLI